MNPGKKIVWSIPVCVLDWIFGEIREKVLWGITRGIPKGIFEAIPRNISGENSWKICIFSAKVLAISEKMQDKKKIRVL